MSYKLTSSGVQRLKDSAFIPADKDNLDWVEFQKWIEAGNTPQPIAAEPSSIAIDSIPTPTLEDVLAALKAANIPVPIASTLNKKPI